MQDSKSILGLSLIIFSVLTYSAMADEEKKAEERKLSPTGKAVQTSLAAGDVATGYLLGKSAGVVLYDPEDYIDVMDNNKTWAKELKKLKAAPRTTQSAARIEKLEKMIASDAKPVLYAKNFVRRFAVVGAALGIGSAAVRTGQAYFNNRDSSFVPLVPLGQATSNTYKLLEDHISSNYFEPETDAKAKAGAAK